MLRIQVAHSYFLRYDRKQWERGKPYPPLATIHVAAMLRDLGHHVSLFDAMLAQGVEDFGPAVDDACPELVVIYEDNFNFLTKMCLGRMREAALLMIGEARSRGARAIVAGSDASDQPEPFLAAGAHAVLMGEGVGPLLDLVHRLDRGFVSEESWSDGLHGVATMSGGAIHVSRPGAQPPDPRLAVHPAWDLVDIEPYRALWMERHGYFSLNMAASRGCPFRCNWCAKPIWGNHYSRRTAQSVANEMSRLRREFHPDHIWMADDIFGFHTRWVDELAEHMHAGGGTVPFTIQTRADLASEGMAAALHRAGCVEAWIGAESGSQRVLDHMAKGTQVEDLITARMRLGEHGIKVGFFIQLGYLGEDLDDLLATRDLIARARPDDIGVSVSYPLPGTRFYEQVKAQMGEQTHWHESNDLAMMFQGAYDTDFYRRVRDLLHEQVTLQQWHVVDDGAQHQEAVTALDSRWDALLATEQSHRTHRAEARIVAMPHHARQQR